jgi:aspartate aminotransferase
VGQQWRFDRVRADAVRRRGGHCVDLSYASPQAALDPRVRGALVEICSTLPAAALQYSPYGGATKARRLVATTLARMTDLPFDYNDVTLTGGATAALQMTIGSAFTPGDEVLLLRPTWFDYPLYLHDRGLGWRFVELTADKRLDLERIAAGVTSSTAGLILCQPQSPTGVVLTPAELRGVGQILEDRSNAYGRPILLISDESHRDTAWSGADVRSPLEYYSHTISIYSFGKAWHAHGLRIGYAAVSPESPLRRELRAGLVERARIGGFGCANAIMQALAVRLLRIVPDQRWLRDAQLFVRDVLQQAGYKVITGGATGFVYVKAPIDDEWRFIEALAQRGAVTLPSALCHEPGHFRLALNVARSGLEPVASAFGEVLADL